MKLVKAENTEDLKNLSILASDIWHEYWTCILSNEQIDYMVEKFQSFEAMQQQIEQEKYSYYFIVANNDILGYCGISEKDEFLFLSKLYLKKEYRHLGYGSKAFAQISSIAKDLNYKTIRLTVNKNNTNTITAYLKYGFKIVDAVVTNIGSGFVMDDYIMDYSIE